MPLNTAIIDQQLNMLHAQRDQASQTFQQCLGAISVLQEQLKIIDAQKTAVEKKHDETNINESSGFDFSHNDALQGVEDGENECEKPIEAANV
jgi:hypothetical protein